MRGDQPLKINWTKNGVDLGNRNSNLYTVDHTILNHTGLYGCMAENGGERHMLFFGLT